MAFDVEGRLYKKFETTQITEKFKKREFVLEIEDGAYTQMVKMQLTQNNCEKLDPFEVDDHLKVTFSLRGREYTKEGNTSYFTNLDAWRIEKVGGQSNSGTPSASIDTFPSVADEPTNSGSVDDDLPF